MSLDDGQKALMDCHGSSDWTVVISLPTGTNCICYTYVLLSEQGTILRHEDTFHSVSPIAANTVINDQWLEHTDNLFDSRVFRHVLFAHRSDIAPPKSTKKGGNIHISISVPRLERNQAVGIIGNIPTLGEWNRQRPFRLSNTNSDNLYHPLWTGCFQAPIDQVVEYKYIIYNLSNNEIVDIEWGENRHIWSVHKGVRYFQRDDFFRYSQANWKGAGVAIPMFSLRSEQSFGIGEFCDLKLLADWCVLTGQKIIQTLPINDTTLLHTNRDSYPYNAVSVFALHPIYINVEQMGTLTTTQQKRYLTTRKQFNAKPIADYQCVYDEKMIYFKALFRSDKGAVFSSDAYRRFFQRNASWLVPYSAFMSRRDKLSPEFYCYLQFHADKQLSESVAYAHSIGVAIKGDIPIGVSPYSVDVNEKPELFHLDASAGAPPDAFDAHGQNWGFPTYNWDVMAANQYDWWKSRLVKMSDYFDAYRIDHILGFFRIWQMRKTDVWGLCGHFSPALPYTLQELRDWGIKLDEMRLTEPYIRHHCLHEIFGDDTDRVKQMFLHTSDDVSYTFLPIYDTQRKVQAYFDHPKNADSISQLIHPQVVLNGLLYLHCEVLFVRDQTRPELLHPRIALCQTYNYRDLYDDQRHILGAIHDEYFYHRHAPFWHESALKKLPELIHSTDMLCCGEDLGMVPSCVPEVMHKLQILSLEIQRMPKDSAVAFAHPANAPYMSVCTTGTHDTSPLRKWWEEDKDLTQRFYSQQMGWQGIAPKHMTAEIAECIINQHMYSPAMWVILPLQDWFAIDESIRLADSNAERINIPSDPHHFWCYRMHITLERLITEKIFNQKVKFLTAKRQ